MSKSKRCIHQGKIPCLKCEYQDNCNLCDGECNTCILFHCENNTNKDNPFKRKANLGDVYMINTSYIDNDKKPRRRFVITKISEDNVSVQKIVSVNDNTVLEIDGVPHIVEIKPDYKGLKNRSGVLNREFRNKHDRQTKTVTRLNIKDTDVFGKIEFTIDEADMEKVIEAQKKLKTEKRKKNRQKKKGKL